MRRFGPLLLAAALLGAAVPVLAVSDSAPDDLEHNRRLLDKYRADPDHYARLLRDLRAFQALPADRQERMRQFDRELHEEDPATQSRLWDVLERYSDWASHLQEADQKRIDEAPDRAARLAVVRELREKDWISRLPKADREGVLNSPEPQRSAMLAELRQKERQRRQAWLDWAAGQKTRPESSPVARPNRPARLSDFPQDVQTIVANQLTPVLSDEEKERLKNASERSRWPTLAHNLLDLSEQHHMNLPGPPELWADARAALPDVPDKILREFRRNELSPEGAARFKAASDDPMEQREIVKQEYFKKYPNQLPRFRRLERRGPVVNGRP